jgi:hypothetical protein
LERELEILKKAREEEEERRRKKQEEKMRSKPYFLQNTISLFPKLLASLQQHGISLRSIDRIPQGIATPRLSFYVVHHTARLESVNLDPKILQNFKQTYRGDIIFD